MKYFYILLLVVFVALLFLILPSFFLKTETIEILPTPSSAEAPQTVSLLFGGDVMLSRNIGMLMERKEDYAFPFRLIAPTLTEADLAIVNLESPISDRGRRVGSIYSFRADPRSVEALTFAGIDVVSLANNHLFDYGAEALLDTLRILRESHIGFAGAGEMSERAHEPYVVEIEGVTFGFLSYTSLLPAFLGREDAAPAVSLTDEERMPLDIERARGKAQVVIALFHFGDEYELAHNREQERIARAAIDAGASLVVGHHPHVPQDSEWYKHGYISYSLGNLVFDQNFEDTKKGKLLKVNFRGADIVDVQELPIAFTKEFQPYVIE